MKKILTLLIVMCFGCLMIKTPIHANTCDYQGINYINPADFSTVTYDTQGTNGFAQLLTSQSQLISIKSNVEYFLLPLYVNKQDFSPYVDIEWTDLPLFQTGVNTNIATFDESGEVIESLTLSKKLYSNSVFCGYAMSFDTDVFSIRFNPMTLSSSSVSVSHFSDIYETFCNSIDGALILIEASRTDELIGSAFHYASVAGSSQYDVSSLYFGENLSLYAYGNIYNGLAPVIDANQYSVYTTVDEPMSIQTLQETIQLRAYDEIDGDITNSIVVSQMNGYDTQVLNVQSVGLRALGSYDIVFSATDQSENTSYCTITMIVRDILRPVLNMNTSTLSYVREVDESPISLVTIINAIDVSDNYSTVTHEITNNSYTGSEQLIGTYSITLMYSDTSQNALEVIVSITVQDTTCPTIMIDALTYATSYTSRFSIETILTSLHLTVSDNYDASIGYQLINNQYTNHEGHVGVYSVTIKVVDSSGNQTTQVFTITIYDDVPPIFYLDVQMVTIELGSNFNYDRIQTLIMQSSSMKTNEFEYEIIRDTYQSHTTSGEYPIDVKIKYLNGDIDYQRIIVNVVEPATPQSNVTFLSKVWDIIKKIFQWIWNIIRWPFVTIAKLF